MSKMQQAPVTLALPSDGSTLAQHKLLRFQVAGFVKGMQYHAQAELEWHIDGNRYQARQRISAFLLGSMEQTSQGLLTPLGLQPMEFTDRRFAKKRSVTLDWEVQQASFTPLQPATPIGPGTQDRLSVFCSWLQSCTARQTCVPLAHACKFPPWAHAACRYGPLKYKRRKY
nr:hypothetical protein [Comamonas jiangduensis]